MPQIVLDLPEGTPQPTPEQKARLEELAKAILLNELWLQVDYIAGVAKANGLTPERLDEILAEKPI